jgi:malate synthase
VGTLFTPEAEQFLTALHVEFETRRQQLLQERKARAEQLKRGAVIDFPAETEVTRLRTWRVAPAPPDLADRRVEITGPVDAKMIINALNSGAKVFMADLEDATSPSWSNIVQGHLNLQKAVRRTLKFESDGKSYVLKDKLATLVVRPRGWHLNERHYQVAGEPMSASLFDFGLYFFHNAGELLERGSGPYFYLPKLENRFEAKLWNDVFIFAQDYLKIHQGTIRATVLLETITAAFEMEEILFELREHASGLNAGRWDYLFSMIKKFSHRGDIVFPDRVELTMTVPYMRAYTSLLVESCHKRGAHAIGGMSAFIPSRRDAEVNARAMEKVREDKQREAGNGFDGTWVAHPDLVPVAQAEFDKVLGPHPHQKSQRPPVEVTSAMLWPRTIEGAAVTREGLRNNLNVALVYISSWLQGLGAAAIHNLMEDAATAEIARAELWHWVHHRQQLKDGTVMTPQLFDSELESEFKKLHGGNEPAPTLLKARGILRELVLNTEFTEFLTLPAYQLLEETP